MRNRILTICMLCISVGLFSCDYSFHKMKDDADNIEREILAVLYVISERGSVVKVDIIDDKLIVDESTKIDDGVLEINLNSGNGRFYAVNHKSVHLYNMGEDSGNLLYGQRLSITEKINPTYWINSAINQAGTYLFLCNNDHVHAIKLNGSDMVFTESQKIEDATDNYPLVHPNGKHLYIHKTLGVTRYDVLETGLEHNGEPDTFLFTMKNPVIRHDQKTVYSIVSGESDFNIFAYHVNEDGKKLEEISTDINGGRYKINNGIPYHLSLHPDGLYLYVSSSDETSGYITIYPLNGDGSLKKDAYTTVKTLKSIRQIKVISGEVNYLVASFTTSDTMILWKIEEDGKLNRLDEVNSIKKPSHIRSL